MAEVLLLRFTHSPSVGFSGKVLRRVLCGHIFSQAALDPVTRIPIGLIDIEMIIKKRLTREVLL
jgi:hypothetical protein